MVKAKVVAIKDLLNPKENPALCLSPLRVFDECHKCEAFQRQLKAGKPIEKMRCKPHLKPEYFKLLQQKQKLLEQLNQIDKQIKNL